MNRCKFLSSLAIGLAALQLRLRPEPVPAPVIPEQDDLAWFLTVVEPEDSPR